MAEPILNRGTFDDFVSARHRLGLSFESIDKLTTAFTGTGSMVAAGPVGLYQDCGAGPGSSHAYYEFAPGSYGPANPSWHGLRFMARWALYGTRNADVTAHLLVGNPNAFSKDAVGVRWDGVQWEAFTMNALGNEEVTVISADANIGYTGGGGNWRFDVLPSSVKFYIDGGLIATHATSIPFPGFYASRYFDSKVETTAPKTQYVMLGLVELSWPETVLG
jgi:hypothetical protein